MTMLDPNAYINAAAPGRDCGTCTLCCKVYDVPVLAKPAGQWCKHCTPGRGCGIHETRPDHCRAFFCLWMTDARLPDGWKPERSKLVLSIDPRTRFLNVQVDPGSPNAWRGEPYLSQLRGFAKRMIAEERFVMVYVNRNATVILPDKEVSLGMINEGDVLVPRRHVTPLGVSFNFDVRRGGTV